MSGRIFIHIGLPKTATSSLQIDLFPSLASSSIEYLGVDGHRRSEMYSDLYLQILSVVNSGIGVQEVNRELSVRMSRGNSLILSEEMFTVSEDGAPWVIKLGNLGRLVRGLNYFIIVTVREPASASFSYYAERYPRFAGRYAGFVDCAMRDPDMKIYHYRTLISMLLENFEQGRLKVYRFEDIIQNDFGDMTTLISPNGQNLAKIQIGNRNSRDKANGVLLTKHKFTALDLVRKAMHGIGIGNAKWLSGIKVAIRPVTGRLDQLVLHNTRIALPTRDELNGLREALADETSALTTYFGITYE